MRMQFVWCLFHPGSRRFLGGGEDEHSPNFPRVRAFCVSGVDDRGVLTPFCFVFVLNAHPRVDPADPTIVRPPEAQLAFPDIFKLSGVL